MNNNVKYDYHRKIFGVAPWSLGSHTPFMTSSSVTEDQQYEIPVIKSRYLLTKTFQLTQSRLEERFKESAGPA